MNRHSWIAHPLTVLALVVLVVNDHLLKFTWPGVVTGKLSDVAGLIVAPALLDLVLRNAKVSIAVTGVGFTLVKATETGAWLASEAWSLVWGPSVILADLTDLLALPALCAAWWAARNPVPVGRTVVVLLIPPAVLAVTATSAEQTWYAYSAYNVAERNGTIVVHTRGGWGYWDTDEPVYVSTDGRTWSVVLSPAPAAVPSPSDCDGDRCYRIVPGRLAVEESTGGAWTTAWEVSVEAQDRLARANPPQYREDREATESLGVAAVNGVVVVANGGDGIAVRDTSGVWRRVGLGENGFREENALPLDVTADYDGVLPKNALLVAIAAALLALTVGVRRTSFAWASLAGWLGCWGVLMERDHRSYGIVNLDFPMLLVLGIPAAVVVMTVSAGRAAPPRWIWPVGWAVGGLVWSLIMLPFVAWRAGYVPTYAQATVLAVVLSSVAAAGGAWVTWRYGEPPPRSPDPSPDP
ncbi:hypothetical protein [Herbidospora cretacea]|uniref:hypothetical protein n=1 Tax=Herbidospora cretacea TaxID=28444 RepID=UPI000773C6EA|nr:hypothetical protein [Herbidospora cretacea]